MDSKTFLGTTQTATPTATSSSGNSSVYVPGSGIPGIDAALKPGTTGANGQVVVNPGGTVTGPGQYNMYGYNQSSANYASDTMAAIARQDYGQYQQYFQPLEGVLAGMVGNNSYNQSQVGTALGNFNNQFDASSGAQNQRDLSRYGLTMNSQQQQSYSRLQNESKSLGQVNAINSTNRQIGQNENSILYGGVGSPTSQLLQSLPANSLPH